MIPSISFQTPGNERGLRNLWYEFTATIPLVSFKVESLRAQLGCAGSHLVFCNRKKEKSIEVEVDVEERS